MELARVSGGEMEMDPKSLVVDEEKAVIQGRSLAGSGQWAVGSGQRAAGSLRGLADRGGSWGNGGVLAAGKAGPRPLTTAETTQKHQLLISSVSA